MTAENKYVLLKTNGAAHFVHGKRNHKTLVLFNNHTFIFINVL